MIVVVVVVVVVVTQVGWAGENDLFFDAQVVRECMKFATMNDMVDNHLECGAPLALHILSGYLQKEGRTGPNPFLQTLQQVKVNDAWQLRSSNVQMRVEWSETGARGSNLLW